MTAEDRAALIAAIEYHLWRLSEDGGELYAIALIAGLSVEDIRGLGGLP